MKGHVHLKINMQCMLLLGIFPFEFKNHLFTSLYRVYSRFMRIYLVGFVLAQYVEIYCIFGEDMSEIIAILGVSLLYSVTVMKVYACRGPQIMSLVRQIQRKEAEILRYGNEDLKDIYFHHVNWNYFTDKLLIWVGVFTVLPFYVNPVLLQLTNNERISRGQYEERPLPFSSWFPFDRYRFYHLAYAYHVLAGFVGGSMTVATDIFFVGLMTYAIGQIKMLRYCFRNSRSIAESLRKSDPRSLSFGDALKLTVGHCVGMHKIIIKYVSDLNESMRLLMLFDFAIASMQMAMLGLQIIVAGFGWQQLFALEFLAAMFIQLFLFYWHANEILLESVAMASSIWESDWFDYREDVKRSLLLVMIRSRRPLLLSVGPFYEMSTQTALAGIMAFDDESVRRVTMRCKETSGVDPALIVRAFQGDITEDVGLRRYFTCFFTEMNFQDDEGHLDFSRIRDNINTMAFRSDDPVQAVTMCEERSLMGSSYEDTIFMNLKCFLGLMIPCCLTMGAQHTIRLRMYARSPSTVLSQQVYLILFGIYTGVSVTPYNPCSQIPCPIPNSRDVSFNAVMNINSTLVPLNGHLNWTIRNERGGTVVCMRTEIGLQFSGAPANACQRNNLYVPVN